MQLNFAVLVATHFFLYIATPSIRNGCAFFVELFRRKSSITLRNGIQSASLIDGTSKIDPACQKRAPLLNQRTAKSLIKCFIRFVTFKYLLEKGILVGWGIRRSGGEKGGEGDQQRT